MHTYMYDAWLTEADHKGLACLLTLLPGRALRLTVVHYNEVYCGVTHNQNQDALSQTLPSHKQIYTRI